MSSAIGLLLCNLARLSKKLLIPVFTVFTLLLSLNGFAANGVDNLGRADYDLDNDGLIEINDLADLDEIRNNLDGKTLYGASAGCPNAEDGTVNGGCVGFELTADLDFDTNGDKAIDSNDTYWNSNAEGVGEGWLPIGDYEGPFLFDGFDDIKGTEFSAHFNGNGYVIKNLTINRPEAKTVGLFGFANYSYIENLVIAGPLTEVVGTYPVGALVGLLNNSKIQKVSVAARVHGQYGVGGLVGLEMDANDIKDIFISGSISGNEGVGGLVGESMPSLGSNQYSIFNNAISSSVISGVNYASGLIGFSVPSTIMNNSYWATDVSTQFESLGSSEANSYVGLSLAKLQCAASENTNFTAGCVSEDGSDEGLSAGVTLYQDWDPAVWNFGTAPNENQQLPGLIFNDRVFRDSDGDGLLDADDSSPFDHDDDGALDIVDAYPLIAVGSLDTDLDGIPNDCDQACLDLGMVADADDDNDGAIDTADEYPLIAAGSVDTDLDGIPNDCDQACLDLGMAADVDDDNDGVLDENDGHSLISIGNLMDTDQDGIPNDCDQTCLDLGMAADADDDNDGVLDENDGHSLIALGDLTDTDQDGIPNDCDQACLDVGMAADADDDNDGVLDENDGHSLIALGDLVDTDQDGIPNECDPACLALGMIADVDDDNDGVLDVNDGHSLISIGNLVDTDQDGIPNDCDQACLALGMVADADDDNDGAIDNTDEYPLIAAGSIDTDLDGIPNECDQACIDLGMVADNDDDNDGVLDGDDGYSLIAIGNLVDTDLDGIPNDCDQACLDLGMVADADDDNDGAIDTADEYPLIAAGSIDTDLDGIPNDCDQACIDLGMAADTDDDNDGLLDEDDGYRLISIGELADFDHDGRPDICSQACITLGMVADADNDNDGIENDMDDFEYNSAAAFDADNDGFPDEWNDSCLTLQCQANSGLILDLYSNDTDNDGATNDVDSDFENDNGKPILLTVASTVYATVNTADGSAFSVSADLVGQMFAVLSATDVVDADSLLSFKAYLNNVELVRDDEGQITLPSGLQVINWVAVDQAGNESESLPQQIFIYPQVRFKSASSITGEASTAEIIIELSGDSPEYPVSVAVKINTAASSLEQADLATEFDISSVHTLSITQGDEAELLNRQVSLRVPIIEDDESENEELLVVELNSVMAASEGDAAFLIDDNHKVHELTVTYQNLAPTVQLLIEQAGVEVDEIKQDAGDVTITAIITDGNGNDEHSLIWDLNSLGLDAPLGRELIFSPASLSEGAYVLSVNVTDNNSVNPLSANAEVSLQLVVPAIVEPPVDPSPNSTDASSGGSSGGAMGWMLLMLMSLTLFGQSRRFNDRR